MNINRKNKKQKLKIQQLFQESHQEYHLEESKKAYKFSFKSSNMFKAMILFGSITLNINFALAQETVKWSEATSWLGFKPTDNSNVIIPKDLTVVLDENTPELATLSIRGKLTFEEKNLKLTADNILVFGELSIGTSNRPFPAKAEIVLTGMEADNNITLSDWSGQSLPHVSGHNHGNAIQNKALIVAPKGKLQLYGAEINSWTQLKETAEIGSTTITLFESPKGWNVGDIIGIAPTDFNPFETEERVISEISGTKVSFKEPLKFRHYGKSQHLGERRYLDMRAEVTNLSRNISITGRNEGEGEYPIIGSNPVSGTRSGYGGHTMYLAGATIKINGVEFANLGISGDLGRYPVHFHHTGDAQDSFLMNSSIHHSFQRGLVVHRTNNLLIASNSIYDTVSHNYYLEDGNEVGNQFIDNLAMLPRNAYSELRIDNPSSRHGRAQERSSSFWITNPGNFFKGNHAVAVIDGMGFWFVNPDDASKTAVNKNAEVLKSRLLGFEDNLAHTIGMKGGSFNYRLQWKGVALELGSNVATNPDNAPIKNFTAWKVHNMAFQIAPNRNIEVLNPTIAESRVYVQSASRGSSGSSVLKINNPYFVNKSNNSYQDRNMREFFTSLVGKKAKGPSLLLAHRPVEFVGGVIFGVNDYAKPPKSVHNVSTRTPRMSGVTFLENPEINDSPSPKVEQPDVKPELDEPKEDNSPVTEDKKPNVDSDIIFNGNKPVIIQHNNKMELKSGEITFKFKANSLQKRTGLFSKDARKFGSGGHITSFINRGKLRVRLQSKNKSYYLKGKTNIRVNQIYRVKISFGSKGFRLYINDKLASKSSYKGGISKNKELLVIGAINSASDSGDINKMNSVLDGEVTGFSMK